MLNCCKCLQISRTFFQVVSGLSESRRWIDGVHRGGRGAGERGAPVLLHSSLILHRPSLSGCGAKRPCRSSGLRRGCRSARPKGPSPCSLIWLRAKTNAKPQEPSNPAPSSNSNLRVDPFPRVSGQQVVAALERLGFRVRRQHGSHIIMRRDNPFAQTVVPARIENWTGAPCGPFCGRRTSGWRTSFDCFERVG